MMNSEVGVGTELDGWIQDTVWIEGGFDGLVDFFFGIVEMAVSNEGLDATFWGAASERAAVAMNEGRAEA